MLLGPEERLSILCQIADNTATKPADRIKAIELMARYGLGSADAVDVTSGGKPIEPQVLEWAGKRVVF